MYAVRKSRIIVVVIASLLVGGFVARAAETDRPNHQPALHHCMVCCTDHHAANKATIQTTPQRILSKEHLLPCESPVFYQQAVIRLPDPPPKFLS